MSVRSGEGSTWFSFLWFGLSRAHHVYFPWHCYQQQSAGAVGVASFMWWTVAKYTRVKMLSLLQAFSVAAKIFKSSEQHLPNDIVMVLQVGKCIS
uniref:Uncharacterized protein n=1 Tax=Physcomitrium patens TaxID=3218 RepID=A0A2K1JLT5_PHYPA|nr:hypothetical protein PHYPA_017337 [Physcomitrium patens]